MDAVLTWLRAHHSWTFMLLAISCSHLVRQSSLDPCSAIARTSRVAIKRSVRLSP